LQTATLQIASSEARQSIIAEQMEAARRELANAEESLRQIQERLEHRDSTSPAGEALEWSRDMAQLRRRLAAALVTGCDADAKVAGAEIAGYRVRAQLLRKRLAIASSRMRFTQADLDKIVADLKTQQTVLEQDLEQAQARRDQVHRALDDAQTLLARAAAVQSKDVTRLADIASCAGSRRATATSPWSLHA
jgi:chromosome segregation ATPase